MLSPGSLLSPSREPFTGMPGSLQVVAVVAGESVKKRTNFDILVVYVESLLVETEKGTETDDNSSVHTGEQLRKAYTYKL